MWNVSPRLGVLAGVVVLVGAAVGCGSTADSGPWFQGDDTEDSGIGAGDDGASPQSDGGTTTADSSTSGGDSATPHDGSAPDTSTTGGQDASTPADSSTSPDTGTVTSNDGFSASRTACINKINALRATDTALSLQPYTLQNTDTINTCVDTQATNDEAMNSPHYSFINNAPACMWGNANGWAQNECESGYGTDPAGIENCLQDMWDERLKPHCTGCVGCTAFGGACNNCDFSGTMGYECGHYVNMSAPYFTSVACGFAGGTPSSSSQGWATQDFQ